MIGILRLSHTSSRFGFITPRGGGSKAYVHLDQFRRAGMAPPPDGLLVSYDATTPSDGRTAASNLRAIK